MKFEVIGLILVFVVAIHGYFQRSCNHRNVVLNAKRKILGLKRRRIVNSEPSSSIPDQLTYKTEETITNDEVQLDYDDLFQKWVASGRSEDNFSIQGAIMTFFKDNEPEDIIDDNEKEMTLEDFHRILNDENSSEESSFIDSDDTRASSPISSLTSSLNFNKNMKFNVDETNSTRLHGRSVGIDLGTTNSAVSIIEEGRPKIVPVDGLRITPSIVSYSKDDIDGIIVGNSAKRNLIFDPKNTFSSVKRIIGRSVPSTEKSRLSSLKLSSRRTKMNETTVSQRLACPALGRDLTPEEISSQILRKLLDAAQDYVGKDEPITRAVVTVPAYFTPEQCKATEAAGKLAGLEKVRLLREPEAAALAYGLTRKQQQIVLVFDLGGGTFDVSVLEVGGGFVEVIATSGDSFLGGDDFDNMLAEWIIDQVNGSVVQRLRKDPLALSRVFTAAEQAKIVLSTNLSTLIDLPNLVDEYGVSCELTRTKFESITKKLMVRLLKPLREAAIMAGVNLPGESGQLGIDESIPAGDDEDMTAEVMSLKRIQVEGKKLAKERQKVRGRSTQELRKIQKLTRDTQLGLFPGGQALDDVILVGGATRIPAVRRLVRVITGVEPRSTVNVDEAVSLGAAVFAGILDGDITDMTVMTAFQAAMYRAFVPPTSRQ